MPAFNEAISKISISKELTGHQPSNSEKVLAWMQGHPEDCKHTTFSKIARTALIPGFSVKQMIDTFYTLNRDQMIYYKSYGRGNKCPKDIYINYLHKKIPAEILDKAPKKDIDQVKEVLLGANIRKEARKMLEAEDKKLEEMKEASHPIEEPEVVEPQKVDLDIPAGSKNITISFTINLNFQKEI